MKKILIFIIGIISVYEISAQSWTGSSLEFTSPGTSYTKFQFAEHTWSGSHAILFNAYKSVSVSGSLLSTGNTKYANDFGGYGGGAGAIMFNANGGAMYFCISPGSTGKDNNIDWQGAKMFINRTGQVGIGTTDPGSFQLAVEGKIGAREVVVTAVNPWPDYVFAKNYNLKSLEATETFIKKEGHLPNIPSASEVAENGILLGEMNAKLLEKIEELTLHLIDQNKRNETQSMQIEKLTERLNDLEDK